MVLSNLRMMMAEKNQPKPPPPDVAEKIDPDYTESDFDEALGKVARRTKPVPESPRKGGDRRAADST